MSVEERHLITGTWFIICCDVCGTVLSEHMNTPWGARDRTLAVCHLQAIGWTDHGTNGEKEICSHCEKPVAQENAEDLDGMHTYKESQTKENGVSNWTQGPLLGFDLETTGTDPRADVPVSFSFVFYDGGVKTHVVGGIINPEIEIPDTAIAVHGITNERAIQEGRDLKKAIAEITDTLIASSKANIPVVGMNVSFDLKMIDCLSRKFFGESLSERGFTGPVLDVLVIDRFYDKYRKGARKLIDLCAHYGVSNAEALHDAQNDVEACIAVLLKQCVKYPEMVSMGLNALHLSQQGWHRDWAENFSKYLISKGKDGLSESDLSWPLGLIGHQSIVGEQGRF
jgi:DNA polymerase-3 subunit epsilon